LELPLADMDLFFHGADLMGCVALSTHDMLHCDPLKPLYIDMEVPHQHCEFMNLWGQDAGREEVRQQMLKDLVKTLDIKHVTHS